MGKLVQGKKGPNFVSTEEPAPATSVAGDIWFPTNPISADEALRVFDGAVWQEMTAIPTGLGGMPGCYLQLQPGNTIGGTDEFFPFVYDYNEVRMYHTVDGALGGSEGWVPLGGIGSEDAQIYESSGTWYLHDYSDSTTYTFNSLVGSDGCDGLVFNNGPSFVTVYCGGCN